MFSCNQYKSSLSFHFDRKFKFISKRNNLSIILLLESKGTRKQSLKVNKKALVFSNYFKDHNPFYWCYRIYSRISRGILDTLLIKNCVGR